MERTTRWCTGTGRQNIRSTLLCWCSLRKTAQSVLRNIGGTCSQLLGAIDAGDDDDNDDDDCMCVCVCLCMNGIKCIIKVIIIYISVMRLLVCVMQVLRFLKECVTDLVKCLLHSYDLNTEYRTMVDYGDGNDDDVAFQIIRYLGACSAERMCQLFQGVRECRTLNMCDEHSIEWICNNLDHL